MNMMVAVVVMLLAYERIPSVVVTSEDDAAAVLSRLAGHEVRRQGDRVYLLDVEGGERPWIGVVERRGRALWIVGDDFAFELRGPLARPRLAGPGYTVWIAGRADGTRFMVRRLGVLRAAHS